MDVGHMYEFETTIFQLRHTFVATICCQCRVVESFIWFMTDRLIKAKMHNGS